MKVKLLVSHEKYDAIQQALVAHGIERHTRKSTACAAPYRRDISDRIPHLHGACQLYRRVWLGVPFI